MEQGFLQWLMGTNNKGRKDNIGLLIQDIRTDIAWPLEGTLTDYLTIIKDRGWHPDAHDTLRSAWKEYQCSTNVRPIKHRAIIELSHSTMEQLFGEGTTILKWELDNEKITLAVSGDQYPEVQEAAPYPIFTGFIPCTNRQAIHLESKK